MSALLPVLGLMARALLLTIAFELPLGFLFTYERTRREVAVISLAQVVTNPSVQLVCMFTGWHPSLPLLSAPWVSLLLAEVAVCAIEALLYRLADITSRPLTMSAVLNASSFGLGLVLNAVGLL